MPDARRRQQFAEAFPDGLLLPFQKAGKALARDYKWLGSHRYAVMHLGGRDEHDLEQRCRAASALLGWPAPYASGWLAHDEADTEILPADAAVATS